eukprot:2254722-Prymnesium_polylepis.1
MFTENDESSPWLLASAASLLTAAATPNLKEALPPTPASSSGWNGWYGIHVPLNGSALASEGNASVAWSEKQALRLRALPPSNQKNCVTTGLLVVNSLSLSQPYAPPGVRIPSGWTDRWAGVVDSTVVHGGGGGAGGTGGGDACSTVKCHIGPWIQWPAAPSASTRQLTSAAIVIRDAGGVAMLASPDRLATKLRLEASTPAKTRWADAPYAPRNIRSADRFTPVALAGGTGDDAIHSRRPGIQ